MIIVIGSDHAGFKLKEILKDFLTAQHHKVIDVGAQSVNPEDHYPSFAHMVAMEVQKKRNIAGILLCGSGQGVCITANRYPGVRAALAWNVQSAIASRQDDNANILCLGARLISASSAKKITEMWLATKFSNLARHKKRIAMIEKNPT